MTQKEWYFYRRAVKRNLFFFPPLERWGRNIKGHFYIVNLFTDSPFAFILEKYVQCQWVAILPSVSGCFPSHLVLGALMVPRGAHGTSCITVREHFSRQYRLFALIPWMRKAIIFFIYPMPWQNSKKYLKRKSLNSHQSGLLVCFLWTKWPVDGVHFKTFCVALQNFLGWGQIWIK